MGRFLVMTGLCFAVAVGVARGEEPRVAWRVVERSGSAIPLYKNSHATAAGWVTAYHGLKKPGETDKEVIAALWVRMQTCDCDAPGKPTLWNIYSGMKDLFSARGYPGTGFKERCRYSEEEEQIAGFDDYTSRIRANLPVVLTFCYEPEAKRGLGRASRRVSKCFSMAGIGHLIYNDQKFLICHDGIDQDADFAAKVDRVDPAALGLPTEGKPWGQSGTSLYRWDGKYTNLVMLFVGTPSK